MTQAALSDGSGSSSVKQTPLIPFPRLFLSAPFPEPVLVPGVSRFLAFRPVAVPVPAAPPDDKTAAVPAADQPAFRSVRLFA